MSRLYPLLAKFGLFARKPDPEVDMFELRLIRIGNREARARNLGPGFRAGGFRNQSSRQAGAALS